MLSFDHITMRTLVLFCYCACALVLSTNGLPANVAEELELQNLTQREERELSLETVEEESELIGGLLEEEVKVLTESLEESLTSDAIKEETVLTEEEASAISLTNVVEDAGTVLKKEEASESELIYENIEVERTEEELEDIIAIDEMERIRSPCPPKVLCALSDGLDQGEG